MAALQLATVGGKVYASIINAIIAVLTPATTYTPTISNWASTTGPTTSARYWRVGNLVRVQINTTLGTSPVTVGDITFTVPPALPIDTTGMLLNSTLLNAAVGLFDVGTAQFTGVCRVIDANTIRVFRNTSTSVAVVSNTAPFTWTAGDQLTIDVYYPVVP